MKSDENHSDQDSSAESEIDTCSTHWSLNLTSWVKRYRGVTITLVLVMSGLLFGYQPVSQLLSDRAEAAFKNQCKIAVAMDDWAVLSSISNRWLETHPKSNDASIFAAEAAVQLDELEKAAALLDQVNDNYHGVLPALSIRADILFSDLNRPLDAEATWKRMLKIDETADVAHQRLIYFYAMTLQRQKMLGHIHRTMKLGRESLESYSYLIMANSLNFSDGLTKLSLWRRSAPDDETLEVAQSVYAAKKTVDNGMATFGIQTIAAGDRTLLENCLKKYPSNPEALALQIEFSIYQGNANDVVKLMSQASESAESDSRFWRYRGWLLAQQNMHEEAAEALEHSLKLHPFEWPARLLLADVYRKLGKSDLTEFHAELASKGKNLQDKLFERPTARDVDETLFREIHDYCREMGASSVVEAIERRVGFSKQM
jgi:tetratricopeptide (TPR) repeat protein